MNYKYFIRELNGDRVEGEILKTILYSLLTSAVVLIVLYYFGLRGVDNFIPKYGYFILMSTLSFSILVGAIRQVRAYKEFACMSGMMIGMTCGMIAGFLGGFYVGSTNGMFYGSVYGMILGIALGVYMGRCCGIMGIMEGVMAGFMGGLMGAMTSVMLLNDHLRVMGVIIFGISTVIMLGLNYMIFFEMKENERQRNEDYRIIIGLSFIFTLITTWLIVYGPRSGVFT